MSSRRYRKPDGRKRVYSLTGDLAGKCDEAEDGRHLIKRDGYGPRLKRGDKSHPVYVCVRCHRRAVRVTRWVKS